MQHAAMCCHAAAAAAAFKGPHVQGWQRMLQQREELLLYARQRLAAFAEQHQLRLLHTPGNPISMAVALGDARGHPGMHSSPAQSADTVGCHEA